MPLSESGVANVPVEAWLESRRRERERLSRILHDDVAGGLTAVGLTLDLLAMDLPPELAHRIAEIQGVLEGSFASVRSLSREFHPDPAIRFRLAPALEALAFRFDKQFEGTLEYSISDEACADLPPAQARAYYAVAEAALDNVLRHAAASRAWLSFGAVERTVPILTIRDDGQGFLTTTSARGTGTSIMEHHIQAAQMELVIESDFGKGTRVQVSTTSIAQKKRGNRADGH